MERLLISYSRGTQDSRLGLDYVLPTSLCYKKIVYIVEVDE